MYHIESLECRTFLSASALDTSFNGTGTALSPVVNSNFVGVVALSDGKVLAAGSVDRGVMNYDFVVERYNANGAPDTSFGGGTGRVFTDFGGTNDFARSLVLTAGGKFVVAGQGDGLILAGYNANGSPDLSFGSGGLATMAFPGGTFVGGKAAVLSDGKLLVIGSYIGNVGTTDFAMARFNSNGTPDTTFGGGTGRKTSDLGGKNQYADAVAILPNGQFLIAGEQFLRGDNTGNASDFLLARYGANGVLDTTFGGGKGWVQTNIKGVDGILSLAVLSNGKVLAGGACDVNQLDAARGDVALVRYNSNGSIDTSFGPGGSGIARTDFGHNDDRINALSVQPNGKILAVGSSGFSLALLRYNANGTLDTSFSGDGKQTVAALSEGVGVAAARGGKTVVAGTAFTDANHAAVARFSPDFAATASIAGTVYNDLNGNGARDSGEPGLSGWQVFVDSNNDGFFTPGETVATSDSSGNYKIASLVPGTYRIREVRLTDFNRTQPAGAYPLGFYDVTLAVGQAVMGKNFGNKR